MDDGKIRPKAQEMPAFLLTLGYVAIIGCAALCLSILIADQVVPDHDWIGDTISDLGAGRYEFIVDIGIYCFSASLIAVSLLAAHVHLGGWEWSVGTIGFAALGLIVFLVGARNEYGDADSDGWVIHIYLVYGIGLLMAVSLACMVSGAKMAGAIYGQVLTAIAVIWTVSAPVFFFLPTTIDGIYERYLGLLAIAAIITLARLFIQRGKHST